MYGCMQTPAVLNNVSLTLHHSSGLVFIGRNEQHAQVQIAEADGHQQREHAHSDGDRAAAALAVRSPGSDAWDD